MADKVALITGGGSGIGKAAALALAEEGFAVVLAGRRAELLEEAASEAAGQALAVPTDVADPASIRDLFARAKETFGRLDLLFNNAGIGAPRRPPGGAELRAVDGGGQREPHGGLPVHPGGLPPHEGPGSPGGPHHQQRLGLGPRAAAELRSLHGYQARRHRAHALHLPRRPPVRHRLRSDRHRQRRDPA